VVLLPVLALFIALLAGWTVARAADPCARWSERVVASGLGSLENVEPDGTGGLLVSASEHDAVLRLAPDGSSKPLVADVVSPGGLRVRRGVLFFNTHDSLQSGLTDTPDGTIGRFDLKTHRRTVYARDIVMPNGLVFLPNGDALTSRDAGGPPAIYVVPHGDPAHPRAWAQTDDSNGMAVDPTGTWLYANQTFKFESPVLRVRIADPRQIEVLAQVGSAKGLDDMEIDRAGVLYLAANGSGEIIRLDPRTRRSCAIAGGAAAGWRNTSAVKFGCGPGWRSDRLYVVGFDGVVRELTPPGPEPHPRGDCSRRLRPKPPRRPRRRDHDWHPSRYGPAAGSSRN
jgi:sugar lactone lactonase YvrE